MYKEPTYTQYFAIFLFIAIALLFPVVALFFGRLLRPHKPNAVKETPYECGMEPIGDAWVRYSAVYYLYALVFVAFAVDVLYLIPVALVYNRTSFDVRDFVELVIFVGILSLVIVYAWKKGYFEWKRRPPVQ